MLSKGNQRKILGKIMRTKSVRKIIIILFMAAISLAAVMRPLTNTNAATEPVLALDLLWSTNAKVKHNVYLAKFEDLDISVNDSVDHTTVTSTVFQDSSISGIAFVSDRNGNNEIYIMNSDGSSQTRLTYNAASDSDPAWSPDGSKIAFASTRDGNEEIYVMNSNGSNQTRLTYNAASDSDPAWSPDGSKIAFTSTRDGNEEIYVMNSNGWGQARLTYWDEAADVCPSWSPDGSKLVFQSDRINPPYHSDLYVMNSDGSGQTLIPVEGGGLLDKPSWSPAGNKIAFEDHIYPTIPWMGPWSCISVANVDGSNKDWCLSTAASWQFDRHPTWSPDGSKIAFHSDRDGNDQIYVMNADGNEETKLTYNSANDTSPAWGIMSEPLRTPVILLPGYFASWEWPWPLGWDWFTPRAHRPYAPLINAFKDAGYVADSDSPDQDFFVCFYDWRMSNFNSAGIYLGDCMLEAAEKTGADKVHIITHSNGANVARAWVQGLPDGMPSGVDTLVMIAPPNHGVPRAYPAWAGGDLSREQMWQWIEGVGNVEVGPLVPRHLLYYVMSAAGIPDPWRSSPEEIKDFLHANLPSLQEGLPVFDYLMYSPLDGWIPYSSMTNTNPFLEQLNQNVDKLINNTEKVVVIAGYGPPTLSWPPKPEEEFTRRGFMVSEPENGQLWSDGKPYEDIYGLEGDGSILISSAILPGRSEPDYIITRTTHSAIVADSCPEVFAELGMASELEHCPAKGALFSHEEDTMMFFLTTDGQTADARLLITDPFGRQLGYKANGVFVNQIPDADYHELTEAADFAVIPNRIREAYTIQVIGFVEGDYNMAIFTEQNDAPLATVSRPTTPGQVDTVTVTIFGDFNGDCEVKVEDIQQVANKWRCRCGDACYDSLYDIDDDCDIDVVDIMKVVAHWGETCE